MAVAGVGQQMPIMQLQTLEGEVTTIGPLLGKKTLYFMWGSW